MSLHVKWGILFDDFILIQNELQKTIEQGWIGSLSLIRFKFSNQKIAIIESTFKSKSNVINNTLNASLLIFFCFNKFTNVVKRMIGHI